MNWIGLIPQMAYYTLWLGGVFTVAETLRRWQVNGELVRKVIHIGVGNIILLAWALQVPRELGILFSLLFSGVALASYRIKILQSLNGVGRKSLGTFFYALSFGLLIGLFWFPQAGLQPFAVVGILIMTWGDAVAALVGQSWGRHPYQIGSIQKSWEGSLTMWGISTLVAGSVLTLSFGASLPITGIALIVGAVATGLEVFSWWGLDNLTVPLISGLLSYWLVGQLT
jgi:phytol kinase